MSQADAGAVVDDYSLAFEARGRDNGASDVRPRANGSSGHGLPIWLRGCARTFEQDFGTVELSYVATERSRTRIAVSIDWACVSAPAASGMQRHGPPDIRLTDDRGQRHTAFFTGVGWQNLYHGHYVVEPPLSLESNWVRVFGEKVPLTPPRDDVTIAVERVKPEMSLAERAARYLVRVASDRPRQGGSGALAAAVDTFVAAGIFTSDTPEIDEAWALRDALQNGVALRSLSSRWASVLARRWAAHDGPSGSRVVAADVPLGDDMHGRVSVLYLRSRSSDFEVVISATEVTDLSLSDSNAALLPFAVYGDDDAEGSYVGEVVRAHRHPDRYEATINFRAPLDPAARILRLTFEFDDACAVVTIPLRWDAS